MDQFGVVPAIEMLIQSIQKNIPNLSVTLKANKTERYHPVIEINVYRIIQEALHNMMKYAKAEEVTITFQDDDGFLTVTIHDNGIGFDTKRVTEGLGLLHMQERISHVNGTIHIDSKKDEGTTIRFSVPAYEEDAE